MKKFFESKIVQVILTCLVAEAAIYLGSIIFFPIALVAEFFGDTASFLATYLLFGGIWVVMLVFWRVYKKCSPMFRVLGSEAKGNRLKVSLPLGLILGLGLNLLLAFIAMLNGDIKLYYYGFNPVLTLVFIVAVAIQSGAEELVCRAFMYQSLRSIFRSKPAIAIIGNALLFSLGHIRNDGVTVLALLNIFTCGILYSLVVYYFDSFWACVIAHTGWNFCQNIILGLPNSGMVSKYSIFKLDAASGTNSFAYNTLFGLEGTVTAVVVLSLACVAVWLIGRKRGTHPLDIWSEDNRAVDNAV